MFSTWFRVHTIALICQVLKDHPLSKIPWRFNGICSMGWYDSKQLQQQEHFSLRDHIIFLIKLSAHCSLRSLIWNIYKSFGIVYQKLFIMLYFILDKDYDGKS